MNIGGNCRCKRVSGEGTETSTRGACAPKQIIMHRFLYAPHCRAPMFGETIECPEFRQGPQFVFRKRDTPFETVQRLKCSILALPDELFGVFPAQSVYDTKTETYCVVIHNCAMPMGLRHANWLDLEPVPLSIFDNRGRRVKTHRL